MAARLEAKRSVVLLAQSLTKGNLHPSRLLLIVAVLIAVAYVTLVLSYGRHRDERSTFSTAVVNGEAALAAAQSGESIEDLEAQLTDLTDLQSTLEIAFPEELKTPDVVETVLRAADEHNVALLRIDISPPTVVEDTAQGAAAAAAATPDAAQAPQRSFMRAIVNTQLRGSLSDLAGFMAALETAVGSASRMEKLSLQSTPEGFVLDMEVHTYARLPAVTPSATPPNETSETGG
ncbi:MAG: hypothetical protein WEE64_00495 [Dehalococcoidia bacterium]